MKHFQRCRQAAATPVCPEKGIVLLNDRHLKLARTAAEAYRRLLEIRASGAEWDRAHRAWVDAAESLAIAVFKHAKKHEVRHG